MPDPTSHDPRRCPAWALLEQHAGESGAAQLADLFAADTNRFSNFSLQLDSLLFDYSRARVTEATLELLVQLAEQCELSQAVERLMDGAIVNPTEGRAALHTALRHPGKAVDQATGDAVAEPVQTELERFLAFADAVRSGSRRGVDERGFTRVINIGIGGSDLGPRLIADALTAPGAEPDVRFVAGLDGMELAAALDGADAGTTLFIICSKTFTTLETRTNADAARAWLVSELDREDVAAHFAAISVNDPAMDDFGVAVDARFRIWDWVGGRFSLWSAVGLSAAIAIGSEAFRELLSGAAAMDKHFRSAPLRANIPVLAGLISVWQQDFLGVSSHVVLPYDQRLELLPAYLQQLFMESLGKQVRVDGSEVGYPTGVPLWGTTGSHSQHSFAQLLHQGCANVQVDYIGTVNSPLPAGGSAHLAAVANLIAQAEALAFGQDETTVRSALAEAGLADEQVAELVPHKVHPGNRPSVIYLLQQLDPRSLGALLAAYEHQVFVQACVFGINPFDQWGVELGKVRAKAFAADLAEGHTERLPGIGSVVLGWRDAT